MGFLMRLSRRSLRSVAGFEDRSTTESRRGAHPFGVGSGFGFLRFGSVSGRELDPAESDPLDSQAFPRLRRTSP